MWIGANIDSGKLSDILKSLKSRLEKEYSADIHQLAIKLASIIGKRTFLLKNWSKLSNIFPLIAEKKEIVPLSYGIWPLPEDLAMLTKHMKNDNDPKEIKEAYKYAFRDPGKSCMLKNFFINTWALFCS